MKKIITLAIIVFLPAFLFAQNSWEKKTSFTGSKRSRSVSFSITNRGYIVGGEDTLEVEVNDCWEYDPGTDSWTQKATLPAIGRRDAVGFSIGLKGYCGTGIDMPDAYLGNVLSDFWEYSPVTNTWVQKASYPGNFNAGVYFATGFAVNGQGYIVCGKIGASYYSNEVWQFNPATNSWTQKTNFPGGVRYGQSSFVLNGKGYVGCGTDENWFTNDFWEYNTATDFWLQKANFPGSSRGFASACAIGTKGYMGMGTDGGFKDDWYEYDAPGDSWSVKANLPAEGRRSSPMFVISGSGYLMMGKGLSGKHRDLWQYKPFITGVEEFDAARVSVYPNPASELINFDIDQNLVSERENLSVQLMTLDGKIIAEKKVDGKNHVALHNNSWAPGIYLYSLTDGTKNYSGGRVVIR
ncbi:MAG: T9SS type A sorting domain-containing protein [Bacteroidota bacterium]|nr:T9SS type A sorting domain-containing protein [Bacteroidota bacterium]